MPTGRVKWFSLEKGFGFISNDEGEDVYLAAAALPEGVATVKPGTKLEFSIADGRRVGHKHFLFQLWKHHQLWQLVPVEKMMI